MEPTIFEFEDYRQYLRYRIDREMRTASGQKTSSLLRFSQSLGYKSQSLLSMVLQGKRLPSDELLDALSDRFNLKDSERAHLRTMVKLSRETERGRDVSHLLKRLDASGRGGGGKAYKITLQQFEVIRDWYHSVIKEMIAGPKFNEDPAAVSRKLRRKISPAQAQRAIENLLAVGLIRRNPETQRLEVVEADTETNNNVPSGAIRTHHAGVIQRAMEALGEQDPENRHFSALCLRFDLARMSEARESVLQFMRQFNSQFGESASDQVFQLNLQFFEHTRGGADGV